MKEAGQDGADAGSCRLEEAQSRPPATVICVRTGNAAGIKSENAEPRPREAGFAPQGHLGSLGDWLEHLLRLRCGTAYLVPPPV